MKPKYFVKSCGHLGEIQIIKLFFFWCEMKTQDVVVKAQEMVVKSGNPRRGCENMWTFVVFCQKWMWKQ